MKQKRERITTNKTTPIRIQSSPYMMSSYALASSFAVASSKSKSSGHQKGRCKNDWANLTFFSVVLFGFALLLLAHQQGETDRKYGNQPSLFPGTPSVTAALAPNTLSTINPRTSRTTTMVSMMAGSSRTLIELASRDEDDEEHESSSSSIQYRIDVTYIDDANEEELLVLRRANIASEAEEPSPVILNAKNALRKAAGLATSPIVAVVLVGNIASVIGILPHGFSGFLPALGVYLSNAHKTRTIVAPVLRRVGSLPAIRLRFELALSVRASSFRRFVSRTASGLRKAVSGLYKNRSRFSPLGDYCWYVRSGEEKKEGNTKTSPKDSDNGDRDRDDGATPYSGTYVAIE